MKKLKKVSKIDKGKGKGRGVKECWERKAPLVVFQRPEFIGVF